MIYYVTMRIDARLVSKVEAQNIDEAMRKAEIAYYDADCGELSDVDGEIVIVEDQDGNYVWER